MNLVHDLALIPSFPTRRIGFFVTRHLRYPLRLSLKDCRTVNLSLQCLDLLSKLSIWKIHPRWELVQVCLALQYMTTEILPG